MKSDFKTSSVSSFAQIIFFCFFFKGDKETSKEIETSTH